MANTTKKIDLGIVNPHKAFYELKADDDLDTLKLRGEYYAPTDEVADSIMSAPFASAFVLDISTNPNAQYVLQEVKRLKNGEKKSRSYEFSSGVWSAWSPKGDYPEGLNFALDNLTQWEDLTINQIRTICNRENALAYLKGINRYDDIIGYEALNASDYGTYIIEATENHCATPYILYSIKTNPDTGEIIGGE